MPGAVGRRPGDQNLRDILTRGKTIAVVGLSARPERDSNMVGRYLQSAGYAVIPINPAEEIILGQKAYPDLASAPYHIDIVNVFRRPDAVGQIVEQAVARGFKTLWLQLGVTNQRAEDAAERAGMTVISNCCIKVEHMRLMGRSASGHAGGA